MTNGIEREVPALPEWLVLERSPDRQAERRLCPEVASSAQCDLQMTREASLVTPELSPNGRPPQWRREGIPQPPFSCTLTVGRAARSALGQQTLPCPKALAMATGLLLLPHLTIYEGHSPDHAMLGGEAGPQVTP